MSSFIVASNIYSLLWIKKKRNTANEFPFSPPQPRGRKMLPVCARKKKLINITSPNWGCLLGRVSISLEKNSFPYRIYIDNSIVFNKKKKNNSIRQILYPVVNIFPCTHIFYNSIFITSSIFIRIIFRCAKKLQ